MQRPIKAQKTDDGPRKPEKHEEEEERECRKRKGRCEICGKYAQYGTEYKVPLRCSKHREEGMVDVKHRRCEIEGCKRRPSYGWEGKTAQFCAEHKEEGMVDVVSKRCAHEGCKKIPGYGWEGGEAQLCKEHREEGMVDVKHRRCAHEGCTTRATYGWEGGEAQSCAKHYVEGMVDVRNPRCAHCSEMAFFFHIPTSAPLCVMHALTGDYAPEELSAPYPYRRCTKCGGWAHILRPKTRCGCCDPESILHRKEVTVVRALEERGWRLTHDKKLEDVGDCTKERPDIQIDMGDRMLVVEVDEHQHESYPPVCEITRMGRLAQALGGQPIVFIRWNPDPFTMDGNPCRISHAHRLDVLEEWMRHVQSMPYPELHSHLTDHNYWAIYLFYNNRVVAGPGSRMTRKE